MRATLNGMLGRNADAPLGLPPSLPAARPILADDARLIGVGVAQNLKLAALAHQVAGRTDAIELARLAYLPDFGPSASINGSLSCSLGSMVMLPTRAPAIRAAINEAQAMAQSSQAMLRQDRAASFVANLYLGPLPPIADHRVDFGSRDRAASIQTPHEPITIRPRNRNCCRKRDELSARSTCVLRHCPCLRQQTRSPAWVSGWSDLRPIPL